MARLTAEEYLAAAPATVRRAMLEPGVTLGPGVAAVVGRFFQALKETGGAHDNPPAAAFTRAAASESTLSTLLRALPKYAPHISTTAGRDLRQAYYAKRPGGAARKGHPTAPASSPPPTTAPSHWPVEWQLLYLGLRASSDLKPSSLKRHIASIDRFASVLPETDADGSLCFYTAFCLGERFREAGIKHKTIAGYLGALVSLGKHGGAPDNDLNGVRLQVQYHLELADMEEKEKVPRLNALMEKGGFGYIAQVAGDLRDRVSDMPAHAAQTQKLRQTIALLAIHMNKPARTGDVATWRLGKDLIRYPDGTWELEWTQEKTGGETGAGRLWDEVCEVLDELILAGRPDRLVHHRYEALVGKNWLTLDDTDIGRRVPSQRIKEAIGVPSHDLRTLAAETLRDVDPKKAPDIIQTHLGHRTLQAGEAYRITCESDQAAKDWLEMKRRISREGLPSAFR